MVNTTTDIFGKDLEIPGEKSLSDIKNLYEKVRALRYSQDTNDYEKYIFELSRLDDLCNRFVSNEKCNFRVLAYLQGIITFIDTELKLFGRASNSATGSNEMYREIIQTSSELVHTFLENSNNFKTIDIGNIANLFRYISKYGPYSTLSSFVCARINNSIESEIEKQRQGFIEIRGYVRLLSMYCELLYRGNFGTNGKHILSDGIYKLKSHCTTYLDAKIAEYEDIKNTLNNNRVYNAFAKNFTPIFPNVQSSGNNHLIRIEDWENTYQEQLDALLNLKETLKKLS